MTKDFNLLGFCTIAARRHPITTSANTTHGRGAIAFPQGLPNNGHALISLNGDRYVGLPVIGFWAVDYLNSNAQPGKLGNYSGAVPLRASSLVLPAQ